MAESVTRNSPLPVNSVSRSGALLAPAAGSTFLTIAATDLPSGYYRFDTTVGLQPNMGSGNGSLVDTRNFVISITGFADFVPQAVLNTSVTSTGFINLNGSQSITLKTGASAASASMIYSIAVYLTKLA